MSIFDALNARNQPQHEGPLYPQAAARPNRGSFARAAGNTGDLYPQPAQVNPAAPVSPDTPSPANIDPQDLARYQYLLRNAPQEDLQRAHEEAFAKLSQEQRQLVLQQLVQIIPPCEASQLTVNPHLLASAATRAELRDPGVLPRILSLSNPKTQTEAQTETGGHVVTPGPYSGGITNRLGEAPDDGPIYHDPAYDNPGYYDQGYYDNGYQTGGSLAVNLLVDVVSNVIGSTFANIFFNNQQNQW